MQEKKGFVDSIRLEMQQIKLINTMQSKYGFSDEQGDREYLTPIQGLNKYGPYDTNTTDSYLQRSFNGVTLFLFYPKDHQEIKESLEKLQEYLLNGYLKKSYYKDIDFKGFSDIFKLKVESSNDNIYSYEPNKLSEKLDEILESIDIENILNRKSVPLAIVGGTTHRSIRAEREQYIEAKREFTRREIASQFVSYYDYQSGGIGILYKISRASSSLGNSLWNIALNLYGKCGGLAWIVEQKISEKDTNKVIDLTIGLRFAMTKDNNEKKKYILGYATILDRFGRLVGVATSKPFTITTKELRLKGMEIPKDTMSEFIMNVMNRVKEIEPVAQIIKRKQKFFVAIHRLALFSEDEMQGVMDGIYQNDTFDKKDVKVGFISILNEPFAVLIDTDPVPQGTCVSLNKNTILLYTASSVLSKDKKKSYRRKRVSYPIAARIQNFGDKNCAFDSLEELANHLLSASAVHWQTVIPGSIRLPASLEFARAIAHAAKYNFYPAENSWLWKTFWFI